MPERKRFYTRLSTIIILLLLFFILPIVAVNLGSLDRLFSVPRASAIPIIVATKADVLIVDINADNDADPGDTIRYTVVVTNFGITDGDNVVFADTVDANSTLVPGSLRTTPIARNDVYATQTNVGLNIAVANGVIEAASTDSKDNDPDGTGAVVVNSVQGQNVGSPASSVNGGSVTMQADGSFVYQPPLDFSGTDSFSYLVVDTDGNLDPATVFVVVSASTAANPEGNELVSLPSALGGLLASLATAAGPEPVHASGETINVSLETMNPGQVVAIRFDVTVDTPFPSNVFQICNQALFTGANFINLLTDDLSTVAYPDPTCTSVDVPAAPDLQIFKDDGGISVSAGDTIPYSISYQNAGADPASGVRITETVPADTSFDESGSTTGWSCADGDPAGSECIFDVGPLAPGSGSSLTFAVQVDMPIDSGASQIVNVVEIGDDGSSGPDQNPADNSASESTPILNQAPIVTVDQLVVSVDEGQVALNGGNASDGDGDPLALSTTAGTISDDGDGSWSWSYATGDGPADGQKVIVFAEDGRGGTGQATFDLNVLNVAPTLGTLLSPAGPVSLYDLPIAFTVVFTDPAATLDAPYSATIDWGDGSPPATASASYGSLSASHTYPAAGVFNIFVELSDKDGGTGTAVYQAVVYDQQSGFVTGGGWIDSPAGAYKPDPSLAGKANFGFVSRYKRGAAVPEGKTVFSFKTAGLNFHSESYQWLIVTQGGTNAQFKGWGTINGLGSYQFMLWAGDDSPGESDTFRIKIWYEANGNEIVVYDNGSQQPIGGGSIIVRD